MPRFPEITSRGPEPREPAGEAQPALAIALGEEPLQGRPQIGVLGLQSIEPDHLLAAGQLRLGSLRKLQTPVGMSLPDRPLFAACYQLVEGVGTDRLQHPVPR